MILKKMIIRFFLIFLLTFNVFAIQNPNSIIFETINPDGQVQYNGYYKNTSNKNINKERPDTFRSVSIFNQKLKKLFDKNFIDNDFKYIFFREDGYHLNDLGHKDLYKKILKLIY